MEENYTYFKRDRSWLSFNYRVLMEADDPSLPIYERIRFLSIYASNLEEFYEVRVSEHRGDIMKKYYADESAETSEERLEDITREVNRQQRDFYRIFYDDILPELQHCNVYLYQTATPKPFHAEFVRNYFNEEVFPFLSPVTIRKDVRTFIRDRRLYLIVKMLSKISREPLYVLLKIPFSKVPRFVQLPMRGGVHYYMFSDDVIRAGLPEIFPGYDIEGSYSIKISRDADIYIDDSRTDDASAIINEVRTKVGKRKIGALSRFMYDRDMPQETLEYVCNAFNISADDLVVGGKYMNLQDMIQLPNPVGDELENTVPQPLRVPSIDKAGSIFNAVSIEDRLLLFPYQSFDYLLRFLIEAAFDPEVEAIKITQYRVAENSAVINALVSAANNRKKVTVFVELKARFDEENNVSTARLMEQAGVKIIYSMPGFKVHAKVAVIIRKNGKCDFAYLSTGNFNEKTARIYSDIALLTSDISLIEDVKTLFVRLEQQSGTPEFRHLLVAPFNMVPELRRMLEREKQNVRLGKRGYVILKMNGLHDKDMIDALYNASENGVEIDLIVRGICCLKPNQPYSSNIRITRIVDMFLEHARVWYFFNGGEEELFLTSADWMRRNLSRRIETAFPVKSPAIKAEIIDILNIQLSDNVKACLIDEHLNNIPKRDNKPPLRAQLETYKYLSSL